MCLCKQRSGNAGMAGHERWAGARAQGPLRQKGISTIPSAQGSQWRVKQGTDTE